MMGGLRAFAQSWAGKLVLIFLAIMLMGSGIVGSISLFTSSNASAGIRAGGQNITELEIAQEARNSFAAVGQQFSQILGTPLTTQEQFEQFGLLENVAESTEARLVNEIAFKEQINSLGISASEAELSAYLQTIFTDPITQQFSADRMNRSIAAAGLTQRAFLSDTAEDLASRKLFSLADNIIFDNEANEVIAAVPSATANAQFNADWSRYDVSYFAIDPSSVEVADPTDEQLAALQAENSDDYQRPEYRDFVGVFMVPNDIIDSIELADEDINATYAEYVARQELATQWSLKQLILDDGAKAGAIVAAVRGGLSFEEAAAANETAEPLDLGPRAYNYGRDALNAAFTATTEAGILDPINDNGRFTVIEVYDVQVPTIQTAEEYRPTAIQSLAAPQASTILSARFDELDGLVGTMSLEEAAAQAGLEIVSGTIAESGPDAIVDGVPNNAKIRGEIFSAPVGETGFRNTFDDQGLFIVRVDGVEESRPLTFDEAKERLTSAYMTSTSDALLTAKGEEALAAVKGEASFALQAAKHGATSASQSGLTVAELLRFSLPIDQIRGSATGDVVGGVTNTGYNVVRVTKAEAANAELDADALAGIQNRLARQYDDELQRAYREAVRGTVNVRVTETVMDRAVTSGLNAYLDLASGGSGQVRLEGVDYGNTGHGGSY